MKHVVVGSGKGSPDAITEALRDLLEDGDELMFPWVKPVPKSLEAVYGYALDNDVPFTILYVDGQSVPGDFREAEHGVVKKVRDPLRSMLAEVTGKVLFLWDDDDPDYVHSVFDASPDADVVELNNGLSPVTFGDAPEVEPAPAPPEDEDDDTHFTREELLTMAAPVVKRYGQRMGCSSVTKSGIIEELFGEEPSTEPPAQEAPSNNDVPFEHELVTLIGNFFQHQKSGFDYDMACLALGQARLWMLKCLSSS